MSIISKRKLGNLNMQGGMFFPKMHKIKFVCFARSPILVSKINTSLPLNNSEVIVSSGVEGDIVMVV